MNSLSIPGQSGRSSGPSSNIQVGAVTRMDEAALDRLAALCRETGVEASQAELDELMAFQSFIESHVESNRSRDVPCMFLWAEWVRFSLKKANRFPSFIREHEFRELIVNLFGSAVEIDEERGKIFSGLRFVFGRNRAAA